MKKSLQIFAAVFAFASLGGLAAYARDSVSLSINTGAPVYYETPPPYYLVNEEAYWWNTPVKVVYFEGRPHRMHYWKGRWYDESWSHHGYRQYDRYHWQGRDWNRRSGSWH